MHRERCGKRRGGLGGEAVGCKVMRQLQPNDSIIGIPGQQFARFIHTLRGMASGDDWSGRGAPGKSPGGIWMWKNGWRDEIWAGLAGPWDLILIGGGITGAGILREASRAGLRTLLLEAHDFASGTSSRSSKMVHGGLRYLRNGQVNLTLESVRERERLLQEGRGLVTSLGQLMVSFKDDPTPLWVFGLGLTLYDLLALKWGHRRYSAAALRR